MGFRRLKMVLRPLAVTDLESIWLHSDRTWNSDQADQYLDQMNERLEVLAENPTLGVDYSHVSLSLRRYQAGRHSVFYRIDGDKLIVVRVLHDRMDAPQSLTDSE